jgi:hypothetical protein
MRSRFWYPVVAVAAVTLSSAAAFAQTAKTPSAQADSPSIVSLAHPANAATGASPSPAPTQQASNATAAPKPQTDQAVIEADRRMREALSRDQSDLVRGYGAGHTEYVDMGGRFSMVTIVVRHSDGTKSFVCVDNYEAARKALDTQPAPAAPLQ